MFVRQAPTAGAGQSGEAAVGSPPRAQDVVTEALSPSAWRVRDCRFPEQDGCALIGFIEKKDDGYEVMQLGNGFQWFTYPSFAEAVAHFVRVSPPSWSGERVLSWVHA
jgi:hypothetical protein